MSFSSRAESGQGMAEFGFLALVLAFLLIGVVDFGRVLMIQHVITNAAREGARIAAAGGQTSVKVADKVREYVESGGLDGAQATITVKDVNAKTGKPTIVELTYPTDLIILRMLNLNEQILMTSKSRMLHE